MGPLTWTVGAGGWAGGQPPLPPPHFSDTGVRDDLDDPDDKKTDLKVGPLTRTVGTRGGEGGGNIWAIDPPAPKVLALM